MFRMLLRPPTAAHDAILGTHVAPERRLVARLLGEMWSTRDPAAWPTLAGGGDRPVLLVPGFLANDRTMRRLGRWLGAAGYEVHSAGIGFNTGCSQRHVDQLASVLQRQHGGPAIVIGQSRGGTLGRALAVQRPDLVHTSITLGAPINTPWVVARTELCMLNAVATLGSCGHPGLISHSCLDGPCCAQFRESLSAPPPKGVRLLCLWSPIDEAVSIDCARDPHAQQHEIRASHLGMGFSRQTWQIIADALGDYTAPISHPGLATAR